MRIYIGTYAKTNGNYQLFVSNRLPKKADSWVDYDMNSPARVYHLAQRTKNLIDSIKKEGKQSFGREIELRRHNAIERDLLRAEYSQLSDDYKNNYLLMAIDQAYDFAVRNK